MPYFPVRRTKNAGKPARPSGWKLAARRKTKPEGFLSPAVVIVTSPDAPGQAGIDLSAMPATAGVPGGPNPTSPSMIL